MSRILWLDFARGYLILYLLVSHGWKVFLTPLGHGPELFAILPGYLHFFTHGFVAISGLGLALLQDKIEATSPIGPYCRKRGLRLMILGLFIALILKRTWSYYWSPFDDWNWMYRITDILTVGTSVGGDRFLVSIGIFVFVCPFFLTANRKIIFLVSGLLLAFIAYFGLFPHFRFPINANMKIISNLSNLFTYVLVGGFGVMWGKIIQSQGIPWLKKPITSIIVIILTFIAVSVIKVEYNSAYSKDYFTIYGLLFFAEWNLRILNLIAIGHFFENVKYFAKVKTFLSLIGAYALMVFELHEPVGFAFMKACKYLKNETWLDYKSWTVFWIVYALYLLIIFSYTLLIIQLRRSWPDLDKSLRSRLGI